VTRRIDVEIGTIVVEGRKLDPHAFVRALRRELGRQLGGPASPAIAADRSVRVARAELEPGGADSSDRIGGAVATAVHKELAR
jgi:hypothetical protein